MGYVMITRRIEHRFERLKCYFNTKLAEQKGNITILFSNLLKYRTKKITKELQNEVGKQCKHKKSENKLLKKQMSKFRKLNIDNDNQVNSEELEQYGRRLCLRIDDVPTVNNQSSDDVLKSDKSLFRETVADTAEAVVDRAHRIRPNYLDKSLNKNCKSFIVRLITFRSRTMFIEPKRS